MRSVFWKGVRARGFPTTTKVGMAITLVIAFPILKPVGYNGKEAAVNTA